MADPHVVWRAQIWADGSSAIISRELVLALHGLGVPVTIDDLNPARTAPLLGDDERRRLLRDLCFSGVPAAGRVRVRTAAPEPYETGLIEGAWDVDPAARANIAYCTLPNGYLPPTAKPATANAVLDQIWACSDFVARTLVEMGFDEGKVRTVNLGFAPDVFHPDVRPAELPTGKRFRFVHASIPYLTYKGIDGLVGAFCAEFSAADDVCLVLQTRPRRGAEHAVDSLVADHRNGRSDAPEILHLPFGYEQAGMARLYTAAQCYVQTSRCEGFGLPVLEAMACGVPSVAVAYGGHLAFCGADTAYIVDCVLGPPPVGAAAEALSSITTWAEPNVDHLRYQLRYAYEHPAQTHQLGLTGAERVRNAFTWTHAAQRARRCVGEFA